jgi:hypothetical protein
VPALDGHVVDPDRRDDDPHDREKAERRPLGGREDGLIYRHAVDRRATAIAVTSAIGAAHCAFIFTPPSRTISVRIGSAATMAVSPSEWRTGSKSWV